IPELSPAVHADATADGPGDSGQTFDSCKPLADGSKDQLLEIDAGPDLDGIALELDPAPVFFAELEDSPIDPRIADKKIRAQTEHEDPDVVLGAADRGILQFFHGSRLDEPPRRATDAVPRLGRQRNI